MGVFSIISEPLGWLLRYIYGAVQNYGLSLLLFTIVTKVIMFPLAINQQKSLAKTAAYQPMIDQIRKKWANDQNRQNEELVKLQKEYGFSPTAGCLPMLVQLPIMIGLVDVIYKPLRYILRLPTVLISELQTLCETMGTLSTYSPQSSMIKIIQGAPEAFTKILSAEQLSAIQNFNANFLGFDLAAVPTLALDIMILIPVLSVVTMVIQQLITMKLNGNTQNQKQVMTTTLMTAAMFAFVSFNVPAGVSLYWIFGNVFGIAQAFVLKKMYDPEDYKAQLAAEVEAKKQEKKKKKTVTVKDDAGQEIQKEMTQREIEALRLQRAREQDREKYGE